MNIKRRTQNTGLTYIPSNGSNDNSLQVVELLLLLFAMIRSVVKSFKVPDVEVAAARMSNESALTRTTSYLVPIP